jgi:hypothetical protein
VSRPQGRDIEEVALLSMRRAGFRAVSGRQTLINGADAFVGTYQGSMQRIGTVTVRAAHLRHDRGVYLVAGIAPADSYDRAEPGFIKTIESFPNLIALYTARAGDTWQAIAERAGKEIVKPTTLAIMNGHAVDDQPQPGERLKIVVSG